MSEAKGKRLEHWVFVFNVTQATAWALLIVPTVLWWKHSILWIALMSVYANFAAAFAGLCSSWIQRQNREVREEDS